MYCSVFICRNDQNSHLSLKLPTPQNGQTLKQLNVRMIQDVEDREQWIEFSFVTL